MAAPIDESPGKNVVSANPATGGSSVSGLKLLLLVLMVLQNSSTVLVGRHTRSSVAPEDLYQVNHLILVIELTKLVFSCLFEQLSTQNLVNSIRIHILQRPWDALKISVPAILYLVQNSLLYIALSNLTAPLFQVTYQGKLVTTALVSVVMLKRSYNPKQWICLVCLSVGVAIVVLGEHKDDKEKDPTKKQSLGLGLFAVTISCLSSALAGVYFEKVLKHNTGGGPAVSLWMRNIQLAFFSVLIAFFQGFGIQVPEGQPYFYGFGGWVWVLVMLQAGGGLLVAAVIKYADNVLKGLATGVSVVLATALSMILFHTPLTRQFCFGAAMILTSVYYFSNPLPSWFAKKKKDMELPL